MKRWHANKIYLKPGEVYFSDKPALVTTLLGSCVTVTMFNKRLSVGAICHGLLPQNEDGNRRDCDDTELYRYVDSAIRCMLKRFASYGIRRDEIEAKLFGGADMFNFRKDARSETVGQQNIMKAREVMEAEGIAIAACDVGGSQGRQIYFYCHTGEVLLKRLNKQLDEGITG